MRIEKAMLVFRKDWREIRRNWQVILPILIMPLIISVFLPVILTAIPSLTTQETPVSGFESLIQNLPIHVQEQIAGMTETQVMIYIMALYFFAPFFLIIPLMASSVIASDSFAGEKERKTIEALLATPISDSELFLGKTLVSFILSMASNARLDSTDFCFSANSGSRKHWPNSHDIRKSERLQRSSTDKCHSAYSHPRVSIRSTHWRNNLWASNDNSADSGFRRD